MRDIECSDISIFLQNVEKTIQDTEEASERLPAGFGPYSTTELYKGQPDEGNAQKVGPSCGKDDCRHWEGVKCDYCPGYRPRLAARNCVECQNKTGNCFTCAGGRTPPQWYWGMHLSRPEPKGWQRPRYFDPLPGCSDEKLLKMHRRFSILDIARRTGERRDDIVGRLRKIEGDNYSHNIRPLRAKLDKKRILFMFRLGMSPAEIGRALRVATTTARRHLRAIRLDVEKNLDMENGDYSLKLGGSAVAYAKKEIENGRATKEILKKFSCKNGRG